MNPRGKVGRKIGGADNVLVDLGFDDAKEVSVRTTLALRINKLLDERTKLRHRG